MTILHGSDPSRQGRSNRCPDADCRFIEFQIATRHLTARIEVASAPYRHKVHVRVRNAESLDGYSGARSTRCKCYEYRTRTYPREKTYVGVRHYAHDVKTQPAVELVRMIATTLKREQLGRQAAVQIHVGDGCTSHTAPSYWGCPPIQPITRPPSSITRVVVPVLPTDV